MKAKKLITGSFLIVMGIHLAVFTGIGIFTSRWGLLKLFLVCLGILTVIYLAAYLVRRSK